MPWRVCAPRRPTSKIIWISLQAAAVDERKSASLTDVSLAQLEYFVAVAEEQHVGRAACKLHVAQPAVSRQIRLLEDELQVSLFRRTPRGMRLSPAGALFHAHARRILQGVREAKDAMLGVTWCTAGTRTRA
ncbi:MAG TPA: LysR family transcriptional regulator [Polyangiaceae bacterium]|nr:LysR family transcriptional regulator [Polyangiaceae bacterium]